MKTKMRKHLSRVFTLAVVVCLLTGCILPMTASASEVNTAVKDAGNGVVQVNLVFRNASNTEVTLWSCSGFLVNDTTVVTSHQMLCFEGADLEAAAAVYGMSTSEFKDRLSYSVTLLRDSTIPATIIQESHEVDWAILKLNTAMQGRTPLSLSSSSNVEAPNDVYVIGFPTLNATLQTYSTFTAEDVSIESGKVNKVAVGLNLHSGANTTYIQSSCSVRNGIIGGPMVDSNGNVVGIVNAAFDKVTESITGTDVYSAIAIEQITAVMDTLGISYTPADEVEVPETTEATVATTAATEAVIETPTVATEITVNEDIIAPTVDKVEDGEKNEGGLNTTMIVIIAAVAVVIVVLVVVLVLNKGKKNNSNGLNGGYVPPDPSSSTPHVTPGFTSVNPAHPTAPSNAGETTVLNQGAGETTVLSHNVNGGTLFRKRTGESVKINTETFILGRERSSVNYCIADNSSVGRKHAKLIVRNGVTYLVDLKATNGTFVNGVKAMPNQEIALKNGDKITLADEELEYRV